VDIKKFNRQYKNIPEVFFTENEILENKLSIQDVIRSGVYFLIKNERIVYVGQSVNIYSRIADHYKNKFFSDVFSVPCPRSNLDVLESMYIHTFSPELNGRSVQGKIIAPMSMDDAMQKITKR
jgi:excinuclease UvrABC nuclease subunit